MTEKNPFEHKRALAGGGSLRCEDWEELLADALDGQLPAATREQFDAHGAACRVCAELLAQARQGQEWLHFLDDEPEAPAGMVARILEKTSGAAVGVPVAQGGPIPVAPHVLGLPVRHVAWDTRMLMTVAMAFFSIALTLNLVGIRLSDVRLADLTPASLEMTLTRGFYGAKGSLVRYYDNLRLVYEVESKMRDLRQREEMQRTSPQTVPANPQGNGHKNGGKLAPSAKVPVGGELLGETEEAGLDGRSAGPSASLALLASVGMTRNLGDMEGSGFSAALRRSRDDRFEGNEEVRARGSGTLEVGEVVAVFWKVVREGGLA